MRELHVRLSKIYDVTIIIENHEKKVIVNKAKILNPLLGSCLILIFLHLHIKNY